MRLIHYTATDHPLIEITKRPQAKDWFKPVGLWVSVEDSNRSWKNWCIEAQYNIDYLELSYDIQLIDNHNVLILESEDFIRLFHSQFGTGKHTNDLMYSIDWDLVTRLHNGIIISPYQPKLRYDPQFLWYSTWDCASGCIWNPDAIRSFTLQTKLTHVNNVPTPL